jgi:hypothetical protein
VIVLLTVVPDPAQPAGYRSHPGPVTASTPPRSRLWARVVGFLLFFVLLTLVNRVFPGHGRWAFVLAVVGACAAVALAPRLGAGVRRSLAGRGRPPA